MNYQQIKFSDYKNLMAYNYWKLLLDENLGIGEESIKIDEVIEESIDHFFKPFSRQLYDLISKFNTLKGEWESQTSHLSSISEIVLHPAYQQIVGMGQEAIPIILEELRKQPNHWFWALKSITGDDPIDSEKRGNIKEMTKIWLKWGRDQGYLK